MIDVILLLNLEEVLVTSLSFNWLQRTIKSLQATLMRSQHLCKRSQALAHDGLKLVKIPLYRTKVMLASLKQVVNDLNLASDGGNMCQTARSSMSMEREFLSSFSGAAIVARHGMK